MKRSGTVFALVVMCGAAVYAGLNAWMQPMLGAARLAGGPVVPAVVNHQGVVAVNGVRFTGSGQFRFVILNTTSGLNLWTNDGTEIDTSNMPTAAVSLSVTDGIYSVGLGDTGLANMTAIPTTVFSNSTTALRIWFNDGVNGNQLLSPDHKLRTVPYAFRAETVSSGSIGETELANAAVTADKLASGAVASGKIAADAVGSAEIAAGAVTHAELADQSVTNAKLSPDLDGWIAAGETWTYASATTFTISGDKTGKYQKGDKIKLTQTTVKYFYIINVAFSGETTTVTVTAGSVYSLANAAITAPAFSRVALPFGFPEWFEYSPSVYWSFSSGGYAPSGTPAANSHRRFRIVGRTVHLDLTIFGYTDGHNVTYAEASLPFPITTQFWAGTGGIYLNSLAGGGQVVITNSVLQVLVNTTGGWDANRIVASAQYGF